MITSTGLAGHRESARVVARVCEQLAEIDGRVVEIGPWPD
jgi:hypothetical protein